MIELNNQKLRLFISLGVFTLLLMLFVSNDSPLGSLNRHVDSAMFFVGGKAWAKGMIPYVDFSDSKGPLLWLIYAIGYLLAHTSYTGVWCLSVLMMIAVLYYCFATAYKLLGQYEVALSIAMVMGVLYFSGFSFLETRAETWCTLPVIYSLWLLVKTLSGDVLKRRDIFSLGVAMGACLLIKWSVAIMLFPCCIAIFVAAWGEVKEKLIGLIAAFFTGIIVIVTPFILYFLFLGALDAFLREYFSATATTVGLGQTSNLFEMYRVEARHLFYTPLSVLMIIISLLGVCRIRLGKGYMRWLLLGCYVWFLALSSYRNHTFYYLQITDSFALIGLIWLASKIDFSYMYSHFRRTMMVPLFGISMILLGAYMHSLWPIYNRDPHYHDVDAADATLLDSKLLNHLDNPTMLCYRNLDIGVGMSLGTVPATKYWFYQNNATEEMESAQDEAVKNGIADIVFILEYQYDSFIKQNGYIKVYEAPDSTFAGRVRVYVKNNSL